LAKKTTRPRTSPTKKTKKQETILVTGIAGSLARLTTIRLRELGYRVIGADYRPRPAGLPSDVPFYQANYNKTHIEDAFRQQKPDGVLHLGRVGNLKMQQNKRFDLNVLGSAKIMELSLKYKVKRLLVLSTFHIYGAHPHNHIPIFEDEPLRATQTFPQLTDAVQLDTQAERWCYKHRSLQTIVLRPCNVVGPHIHNAISRYLRNPRMAYLAGFSPMWQFIHEDDMIDALIKAYTGKAVGVFNVAGMAAVPLVHALELTGATLIPVPDVMAKLYLRIVSRFLPSIPPYLLDFFRYACVISDDSFRQSFGYQPQCSVTESIRSCVNR
jgi:UDP-glucose 4-epimerase